MHTGAKEIAHAPIWGCGCTPPAEAEVEAASSSVTGNHIFGSILYFLKLVLMIKQNICSYDDITLHFDT